MIDNRPIGVFDSGMGGLSVLYHCINSLPNEHFIFYGDSINAPYGIKEDNFILSRCIDICNFFKEKNCKAIIIACNTATSIAVEYLRNNFDIPIIGMEPAVKVACDNPKNKNIIVLATPLTLKREKYLNLIKKVSNKDHNIISIPANELVEIVETNRLNDNDLVIKQLNYYFNNINMNDIDAIVLGCTHFIYYKKYFKKLFPNIQIIDGNTGTVNQLINNINFTDSNGINNIELYNSDNTKIKLEIDLLNQLDAIISGK